MPGYFEINGVRMYSYGLFTVLGFTAVALLVLYLFRKRPYVRWATGILAVWGLIGLYLGAHLLFGLTQLPSLLGSIREWTQNAPASGEVWRTLAQAFGGMVYYGGFLGLLLASALWLHRAVPKPERGDYYDLIAVCVPLFHAFGRLGCFSAGCCYGVECSWGIVSERTLNPDVNGVARFPVQLVEAGLNLLLFDLLLMLFLRERRRGGLMRLYCLLYPLIRFTLEFFRGDTLRGLWGPFSTSQWVSLALFAAAAALEIRAQAQERSAPQTTTQNA